jgi:hypothetical protein
MGVEKSSYLLGIFLGLRQSNTRIAGLAAGSSITESLGQSLTRTLSDLVAAGAALANLMITQVPC